MNAETPSENKLRVLLVDDEPLAVRQLERALAAWTDVEVVGQASDGDAALAEVQRLDPDLIFLDVEMPGRSGLTVASSLDRDNGADIVIHSAFDRYAAAAFDVEALDYLAKPLRPDRLREAIDRALRRRAERNAYRRATALDRSARGAAIHVPDRNGGREVPLRDIVWIEADRDYALLHTASRTHILRTTMAELTQRLPDGFLRVHRSAFVALAQVRQWGAAARGVHCLVLRDGIEVAVGPSYLADVRTALRSLPA